MPEILDPIHPEVEHLEKYLRAHGDYLRARRLVSSCAGSWCRVIRKQAKVSIHTLAREIDLSTAYICKVERGIEAVSPDFARKLLDWARLRGLIEASSSTDL